MEITNSTARPHSAAEIAQNEGGSKHARAVVSEENFWVTMFQSKDQSVTTITISR
jgi:hypothetical protein